MAEHVLDILQARGFIAQATDAAAVRQLLAGPAPQLVYTGYDPTGASLHVGHLLTIMAFKHLQRAGHRPLVVLGGGTALVGDPSGKSVMRPLLGAEAVAANLRALQGQLEALLACAAAPPLVLDNNTWLRGLHYVAFLRDIGRHFSVNRMLAAEAYRARLKSGLSFIEFNYQILQAYDFLTLQRQHGCRLQLGGDDQWGNILAGVELCRRVDQVQVEGLTYPLLTTANGAKMGKTAQGAVWLDAQRYAPGDFYQFWVNCDDADLPRLLRLFTFLPLDEVEAAAQLSGAARNAAKSVLAYEVCAVVHGAAAAAAHAAAAGAFGGRILPPELLPSSVVPRHQAADAAAMPHHVVAQDIAVVALLVAVGFAASKGAARRLVEQGAVALGERRVEDVQAVVAAAPLRQAPQVLRAGKKRLVRLVGG